MKRTSYRAGLLMAVLMSLSIHTVHAQWQRAVGLDAVHIRMSNFERLERRVMTPARLLISGLSSAAVGTLLDVEPMQDDQLVGGALVYGSQIERLGVQLSYFYFLTAVLAVGGDLTLFFPDSVTAFGVKTTQTLFALNVLAHYILYTSAVMRAYALGGLNLAIFRFKSSGSGLSISDSSSELGLKIGGGIEYALAAGFLFLELSYAISNFDQLVVAAGYRIPIGR